MARYQTGYQLKLEYPQGSISGPLFLLIYINNLPGNFVLSVKLSTDDISLFSSVLNTDASRTTLNDHFKKISEWALSGKCNITLT